MTIPREQQVNKDQERAQLIQDIKKQNPDITDEQLNKYDIDDLRKIKIATAPEVNLKQPMQMGGMADMSAAPMVQPRKKKKKQRREEEELQQENEEGKAAAAKAASALTHRPASSSSKCSSSSSSKCSSKCSSSKCSRHDPHRP